ncbi:fas apoptotic inhibitory molecule 1-like, partial [Lingula anatina]
RSAQHSSGAEASGGYVAANNVKMWNWSLDDEFIQVIFRKDTMECWVNDTKAETMCNFSDTGAEMDFCIGSHKARIKSMQGMGKRDGIIHVLTIDGYVIPEDTT